MEQVGDIDRLNTGSELIESRDKNTQRSCDHDLGCEMDKDIEASILRNATELEIAKISRSKGMLTMKEDAIIKAMHQVIPFEEVNTL